MMETDSSTKENKQTATRMFSSSCGHYPLSLKKVGIRCILRYLFLGGEVWVDGEVYLVHEALDHGDGVGAAGLRVDGLLHDDGGDVAELAGELRLPLLAGDLELPFLQNLKKQSNNEERLARGLWIEWGLERGWIGTLPRCRFGSGRRCRRPW